MGGKERISNWQYTCSIIGFLLGTSIVFSNSLDYAKRDAWIAEVISALGGLLILLIIAFIINKFPEKTLTEIFETLFNPVLAKILIVPFFIYAILIAAFVLNIIQTFMNNMTMQETPPWVFILTMALSVGIIVKYGIEVFVRCTEIVIPLIIAFICLLFLVGFRLIDIGNLKPLFAESATTILKATIASYFVPYFELTLLIFFAVYVKKTKTIYKNSFSGLIIAGFLLISRIIYIIGIFGSHAGPDLSYPLYSIVRQITFGEFLERIELFLLIVWFLTVFIKIGVCIFVSAKSFEMIFKLADYKKVVLPISILLVPLAIKSYETYKEPIVFISSSWPIVSISLQFIPLIVIFLACVYNSSRAKLS